MFLDGKKMGSFTKAEQHLNLAREEITEALRIIERMRQIFKDTPQEEIDNIRQKLNELERRIK